jgi:hypothetical protein
MVRQDSETRAANYPAAAALLVVGAAAMGHMIFVPHFGFPPFDNWLVIGIGAGGAVGACRRGTRGILRGAVRGLAVAALCVLLAIALIQVF